MTTLDHHCHEVTMWVNEGLLGAICDRYPAADPPEIQPKAHIGVNLPILNGTRPQIQYSYIKIMNIGLIYALLF
jgi:hypothetical protein